MAANAWTFAGSGRFTIVKTKRAPELVFHECAMCHDMHESQPMCDFYAGTVERLIAELVSADVRVMEIECMATGAAACRFQLQHV